jgi:hypothetical protein
MTRTRIDPRLCNGATNDSGGGGFYLQALVKDSARARLGDDPHVSGQKKKRTHRGPLGERTSPFLSFWYCGVGAHEGGVLSRPDAILKDNTCMLAKTPKQLPSILQAM